MNYPSISLITACYNHKNYIAETIESIISQKYPNLQYVVIDDGSTDGSWEVIQKYQKYLHHCEQLEGYRKSPTIALNIGMSKVNADIMGWLNSDDILLPKSLFVISEVFAQNKNVEWFTGMASTINHKSQIVNSKMRPKNIYDYLIGDWKIIQQESTFFKRNLWQKAGKKFIEDKWAFDTELWTRFFSQAEHYHVSTPIGAFRKGKQSKSISDPRSFLEPNENHLRKMKEKTGIKLKLEALVYKICKKIFWPILFFVPNSIFKKIPLFKKYTYKVINYNFEKNQWLVKKINPFSVR